MYISKCLSEYSFVMLGVPFSCPLNVIFVGIGFNENLFLWFTMLKIIIEQQKKKVITKEIWKFTTLLN